MARVLRTVTPVRQAARGRHGTGSPAKPRAPRPSAQRSTPRSDYGERVPGNPARGAAAAGPRENPARWIVLARQALRRALNLVSVHGPKLRPERADPARFSLSAGVSDPSQSTLRTSQ